MKNKRPHTLQTLSSKSQSDAHRHEPTLEDTCTTFGSMHTAPTLMRHSFRPELQPVNCFPDDGKARGRMTYTRTNDAKSGARILCRVIILFSAGNTEVTEAVMKRPNAQVAFDALDLVNKPHKGDANAFSPHPLCGKRAGRHREAGKSDPNRTISLGQSPFSAQVHF